MLSRLQRVNYGIGGAVFAVKEAAYIVFVLLFYTQLLGLSGTATGVILFLAVIWDAFSDPLIGIWSDRSRSRWGRRHPYMVVGAIPMGLGFLALFNPPAWALGDQWLLGGWLLFWSLWIRTFLSIFSIPHLALTAEMTSDYQGRSQLVSVRTLFVFLGAVVLPAVALLTLFAETPEGDGRFVAANYPMYGLWSCLAVWVLAAWTIVGTRHAISPVSDNQNAPAANGGFFDLFHDFRLVLRNRNFRNVLIYDVGASASYGILGALNIMAWTYYWELSAGEVSLILWLPSVLAVPLAVFATGPLGRRWSKHRILQVVMGLMIIDAVWLFPLRMFDLIPENGHPLVFFLASTQMFFWMFLFVLRVVFAFSIIADVTDEHDLEHGRRQEGGFFAALNFTTKLASAIGPLYAGLVLDMIDLRAGMLPGEVPQWSLSGLALGMAVGIIPTMLLAWRYTYRISMSAERLGDIQEQLRQRDSSIAK
jgi:GPH family glycoside/pentoside/hexuronide:cation symporter